MIREWIERIYHHRPHGGLVDVHAPGLALSPAEMFQAGLARAGLLRVAAHPGLVFDFLPTAWRTIQHYGVELNGLRYNGAALTGYRNRTSPFTGAHRGKWPVRFDPDDVSEIYFQDPADSRWHVLVWEHAGEIAAPFSAETLQYARRLALADDRHVNDRTALAELLQRFDAGLTRHPAERRMAVRASQQRQARLAATAAAAGSADAPAQVAALPTVAALAADEQRLREDSGDDDCEQELDRYGTDEPCVVSDEQYYADAFAILA